MKDLGRFYGATHLSVLDTVTGGSDEDDGFDNNHASAVCEMESKSAVVKMNPIKAPEEAFDWWLLL